MQSPDPGILPTLPPPVVGEKIFMSVLGFPPFKEKRQSLRNPTHRFYHRFVSLRRAAEEAMAARRWYDGPVALEIVLFAPAREPGRTMNDYLGGVMDTLDGSHGFTFTYLPIVFQDDCQVWSSSTLFKESQDARYTLQAKFGVTEADLPVIDKEGSNQSLVAHL